MQMRIIHVGAAVAALVLALTVARTDAMAASDKESCSTTSTDVTSGPNTDGTEAQCDASTGPPNKAKAHAWDTGFAASTAGDMGTATADAKGKDSDAIANGDDGEATATAIGTDSFAAVGAEDGGKGTGTAMKGGQAEADGEGGTATSTASGVGSEADSFAEDSGKAKATAKDIGDDDDGANAHANANCKATANADGADSVADAICFNDGSSVSAFATKGSIAEGFDTAASVCTAKNGGHAKVTSPFDGGCSD